jgi:CheY-like chemotaxis protein
MARVLVANDDREIRELLVEVLTDLGHQVVGVPSFGDAWHLLRSAPTSMVAVLELAMPRSHALELLYQVVADPQLADRHGIIMLTTLPLKHTGLLPENLLSNLPVDVVVLTMPFDLEDLESAVESVAVKCMAEVRM